MILRLLSILTISFLAIVLSHRPALANMCKNVAVVSGGTSGIGLELVTELMARDWCVATFSTDPEKVEQLKRKFNGSQRLMIERLSVTDYPGVDHYLNRVEEKLGHIELLVNNAGVNVFRKLIDEVEPTDIGKVLETNLQGPIFLTRQAIIRMKQNPDGGTIINVSSGSSKGVAGLAAYSASKAGLNAFSVSADLENKENGIRVLAMNPGHVDTPLQARARADNPDLPFVQEMNRLYEQNLLVSPKDSARQIIYLFEHRNDFDGSRMVEHTEVESHMRFGCITNDLIHSIR